MLRIQTLQRGNIQDTFTDLKTNNGTEEACCVGAHHPTIACLAAWVQVGQETVPQSSLLVHKPIYVIVDISMVNTYIYIFQPTETHHQLVILVGGFNPSKKNMSSSVGIMKFPTEWKHKSHVPNHQPVIG